MCCCFLPLPYPGRLGPAGWRLVLVKACMSDCSSFGELISALADGELHAQEAREVSAHLSQCPRCMAEYKAIRALEGPVRRAAASLVCPQPLSERIRARLAEETSAAPAAAHAVERPAPAAPMLGLAGGHWWQRAFAPAVAVAAALLLALAFPSRVPVAELPAALSESPLGEQFPSPDAAASHIANETGLPVRPVSLQPMGMSFASAGKLHISGCRAAFLAFVAADGTKVTVFQVCPGNRRPPEGERLPAAAFDARMVSACDGSKVVFWPQNGMVVAVCGQGTVDQSVEASRLVARQLAAAQSL